MPHRECVLRRRGGGPRSSPPMRPPLFSPLAAPLTHHQVRLPTPGMAQQVNSGHPDGQEAQFDRHGLCVCGMGCGLASAARERGIKEKGRVCAPGEQLRVACSSSTSTK